MTLRGDDTVQLEGLHHLLEVEEEDRRRALVIEGQGRRLGLWGADILGEQKLVIRPLGPFLRELHPFIGSTILDSGEPALLVGVPELLRLMRRRQAMSPERRTVLLVEDSEIVRHMLSQRLRHEGFAVIEAADGRDALERLGETSADLVITDLEMPHMNGFELIAALRTRSGVSAMPVVVLSSRSSEDDRRRATEAGADAYVVKAEVDDELPAVLERLLLAREPAGLRPQLGPERRRPG